MLAAAGLCVEDGSFERLRELLPETSEVVADEHVLGLHRPDLDVPIHAIARGEQAKTLETCDRLWRELRLERSGTLVAVGGGSTTDVAGFVASAYLRGIDWAAVPTTLLGQVDAAIGGQDGYRPSRREEPRRRLPLAAVDDRRSRAARDATRATSGGTDWPKS